MKRFCSRLSAVLTLLCAMAAQAEAQARPDRRLAATITGPGITLYDPARQGCDANDIPDAPLRAFRDETGAVVAFGLHYDNRRMVGPGFDALKVECAIVFRGNGLGDPKRYDDRAWVAATYTGDGRQVAALVHHEFQAHGHAGRCTFPNYIQCWWNSAFLIRSTDGGRTFARGPAPVMAASPEPSETGQGRHRGFFNPSNIVKADGVYFTLISTTGWPGQPSGVCLFRARDPGRGTDWMAHDGTGFRARFPDPYSAERAKHQTCKPIGPFPAPVGSLTRHAASGLYLAVFQVSKGMPDGQGGHYETSGFYIASSPDLLRWSPPSLLMPTRSLYDSPCGESVIRNYPSVIDPASSARNFDVTGDTALLTFTEIAVEGCAITHRRRLVAQKIRILPFSAQ